MHVHIYIYIYAALRPRARMPGSQAPAGVSRDPPPHLKIPGFRFQDSREILKTDLIIVDRWLMLFNGVAA